MLVPSKRGYVSEINELSRKYGDIILKEMVASANMNNRGVVEGGYDWVQLVKCSGSFS
ncbi:hypothetical protein [Clostridium sporogenes]|uniref:hypothetical protein n=1 Tax=Clostridium sporogenes TaxID=1509 RepID=UPI001FAD1AD2|nr:hypothetical protein [Clostridium sporogenes]